MFNVSALMKALPVSGLAPKELACLRGLGAAPTPDGRSRDLILWEPPAGQREPYIDPMAGLTVLMAEVGLSAEEAEVEALALLDDWRDAWRDLPVAVYLNPDAPD